MAEKSFSEIAQRLREIKIEEPFDMIVGIANGGIVPAGIVAEKLGACIPVEFLRINFRDFDNVPRGSAPKLLRKPDFDCAGKRILLVDDRIKTGTTIAFARQVLADAALVKTFAVNGHADYALFDEPCFRVPWKL